jgi:signal transduction histidine kinase
MALLLATLALAGLLAFQAQDDVVAHRATAARAVHDYVTVAARDVLDAYQATLAREAGELLDPVTRGRAASPYEILPPPSALARSAARLLPCDPAAADGDAGRFVFRYDHSDASLATDGGAPSHAVRRALVTAVGAPRGGAGAAPFSVVLGDGPLAGRAIVYAVKYAPFDAPMAAYGVVACASALGAPLVARAAQGAPDVLADSLVVLAVRDARGHVLHESPAWDGESAAREVAALNVGGASGVVVRASLGPGADRRLLVQRQGRPRLAVLVALLAITATLVLVALAQLEREQELVRLRADFTSSVSHELRTPLAQILLYGETLSLGRVRNDAERRVAAETIVEEARRLIQMVENVLHVARAERRANHVQPEPVLLAPLARAVVAAFAPVAREAGGRVLVAVDDALRVHADPDALRQILLNLLDNAVRYGAPERGVSVGASTAPGGTSPVVRVWVDDAGPGVPARDRERVWAPFVRLRRDRRALAWVGPAVGETHSPGSRTGSGLGLAVVRDLALAHGGRAWVEPSPAGGARFVVELPAAGVVRDAHVRGAAS